MRQLMFILFSFFMMQVHGQELSQWKFYKRIGLNTTSKGAAIKTDVLNFPVAVALNHSNFNFRQAKKDGADIRISATRVGSLLSYHIEEWDADNQRALIWVKVPRVKANSADQALYLHFGNDDANDMGDSKMVFDTTDGFVGVWHLNEVTDTIPGTFKDATANEANGKGVNFKSAMSTNTFLGKGVSFDYPQNQWIKVEGDKRKLFDLTKHVTFSIWAYAKSYSNKGDEATRALPGYETMFAKGDNSWRLQKFGIRKWHKPEAELIELCIEGVPKGDSCLVGKLDMATGKWYHFVGVHDWPNVKLYVNGKLDVQVAFNGEWKSGDHAVGIGNQSQFPNQGRQWDGILDEARVMNVSKSEDWIKLEYESQHEGQKFLSVGKTETRK